ncbi:lactonase family protein [Virgibacillus soli]|uniref:Lactonase family protein n=1 Tax=Paracerasibacillus soli TaxID=480284 RepID=A0ABU5CRQ1_9BACI|nr:lactonase family protein [Virgibacillus soli]MDY0409057.1 lactonase family protein [Virgibacillus soli]
MSKQYELFVSCYGNSDEETIHWLKFDETEEAIHHVSSFSGVENPSFVTVNDKADRLYAISEVDQGEVISFAIDHHQNHLTEMNRQQTKGGPCHLIIGGKTPHLFTANYGGGSVIVHRLRDTGEIENETDFKAYNGVDSSVISHVHMIKNVPNTNYFVATDLGKDKLYFYQLLEEEGKLIDVCSQDLPQGSGPRHIAFHPQHNKMYVINEHRSTIFVYTYDLHEKIIKLEQKIATLPEDFHGKSHGAEIQLSSCGKYLSASNRGHDSITSFQVLQDGRLEKISDISVMGNWPRHFLVLPNSNYVIVANEHSHELVVMKRQSDGSLEVTNGRYKLNRPVCVQVLK